MALTMNHLKSKPHVVFFFVFLIKISTGQLYSGASLVSTSGNCLYFLVGYKGLALNYFLYCNDICYEKCLSVQFLWSAVVAASCFGSVTPRFCSFFSYSYIRLSTDLHEVVHNNVKCVTKIKIIFLK